MPSDPLPIAFFGSSFTQDTEKLTVLKTDLQPPIGLPVTYEFTPEPVNRAESIFLALFLRVQRNQDISLDSQMVITPFERELVIRFGKPAIRYFCTFEIFTPDNISKIPSPNLV
jgi:hypothetical protein